MPRMVSLVRPVSSANFSGVSTGTGIGGAISGLDAISAILLMSDASGGLARPVRASYEACCDVSRGGAMGEHYATLAGRVRAIREAVGLTRDQFAERTGVSAATLKSLEQRGGQPKGDVLLAVANTFPEYALWLMTERAQTLGGHLSAGAVADWPVAYLTSKFDPRWPEECVIQPRHIASKAMFVVSDSGRDSGCAIQIADKSRENRNYVWANAGHFTINGDRPSKILRDFIEWMKSVGVEKFDSVFVTDSDMALIERDRVIWDSQILNEKATPTPYMEQASENIKNWTA